MLNLSFYEIIIVFPTYKNIENTCNLWNIDVC